MPPGAWGERLLVNTEIPDEKLGLSLTFAPISMKRETGEVRGRFPPEVEPPRAPVVAFRTDVSSTSGVQRLTLDSSLKSSSSSDSDSDSTSPRHLKSKTEPLPRSQRDGLRHVKSEAKVLPPPTNHVPTIINLHSLSVRDRGPKRKIITFIRHGKSVGNAGFKGTMLKGSPFAYFDGELTPEGERQSIQRVSMIDDETVERIACAGVVLVSPLKRALATVLIILAEAHRRRSVSPPVVWPRIQVASELREKVKSWSDRPGAAKDALKYVGHVAHALGQRLFNDPNAMQSVVEGISMSYAAEQRRTRSWDSSPTNAGEHIKMIQKFKDSLSDRPEGSFLLVGHSGWARFAFSAFLPAAESSESQAKLCLHSGVRQILPLNHCGIIKADFTAGQFYNVDVDSIAPGNDDFPNCQQKKTLGVLVSVEEAINAGVIPDDMTMTRVFLAKYKNCVEGFAGRLFTLSHYSDHPHLAWSDQWGKPLNSMALGDWRLSKNGGAKRMVIVQDAFGDHRAVSIKAKNAAAFVAFCQLLSHYCDSTAGVKE